MKARDLKPLTFMMSYEHCEHGDFATPLDAVKARFNDLLAIVQQMEASALNERDDTDYIRVLIDAGEKIPTGTYRVSAIDLRERRHS